jgi:hypothetical protein
MEAETVASLIYANEKERRLHLGAIHEIARACGRPESEVEELYERQLSELSQAARLKEFVPLLARRVVLESLRRTPAGRGAV